MLANKSIPFNLLSFKMSNCHPSVAQSQLITKQLK